MKVLRIIFILLLLGGCQVKRAVLLPLPTEKKAPIRDHYVLIVNMDGALIEEVQALVEADYLPTIKDLFYENGVRVENALTVFPTLSTPAHQALLSGLQPGHHGLPSLDWFSRPLVRYRDYLRMQDIPYTNALLFNFLQFWRGEVTTDSPQLLYRSLQGYPTLTAMESVNAGCTYRIGNVPLIFAAFRAHIKRSYEALDFAAINYVLDQFRNLPMEQLPRFSMIDLYGMDFTAHYDGAKSAKARDLYIHYDRFLKELVQTLKDRGIYQKSTIILLADHGQHELHGVVDLPAMLKRNGFQPNLKEPDTTRIMYSDHGTGVSHLYFKMGPDWGARPNYKQLRNYPTPSGSTINLIETFLKEPEIDTVISREGLLKTHLHFKTGHALIQRKWTGEKFLYAYLPDPGTDPLGYLQNPQIQEWVANRSFQDEEAWLKATAHLPMPDVIVSVPQLFDDYRVGDLVLITVKDKQFKKDRFAGHGSLYREDRRVPLMFHGPDFKPGVYPHARLVDVFPTVLALFGIHSPYPMDGRLRRELFLAGSPAASHPLNTAPDAPEQKMDLAHFKKFLQGKIKAHSLNEEERNKAVQVLYSLEQFEEDKNKEK